MYCAKILWKHFSIQTPVSFRRVQRPNGILNINVDDKKCELAQKKRERGVKR